MHKVEFLYCSHCGAIVGVIKKGAKIMCCGEPMKQLEANTVDAAHEKHVPVVERKEGKIYVNVGEVAHPMTEEHLIEWIAVVSDEGTERIRLKAGTEPKAVFTDKPNAEVYAYCNLHGLWKI